MPNTLDDLRDHLFATLAALRDDKSPMEVDRAKAISEVAKTVIESAKVQVDYLRVTGKDGALPVFGELPPPKTPALPDGVAGVRTHRIK